MDNYKSRNTHCDGLYASHWLCSFPLNVQRIYYISNHRKLQVNYVLMLLGRRTGDAQCLCRVRSPCPVWAWERIHTLAATTHFLGLISSPESGQVPGDVIGGSANHGISDFPRPFKTLETLRQNWGLCRPPPSWTQPRSAYLVLCERQYRVGLESPGVSRRAYGGFSYGARAQVDPGIRNPRLRQRVWIWVGLSGGFAGVRECGRVLGTSFWVAPPPRSSGNSDLGR